MAIKTSRDWELGPGREQGLGVGRGPQSARRGPIFWTGAWSVISPPPVPRSPPPRCATSPFSRRRTRRRWSASPHSARSRRRDRSAPAAAEWTYTPRIGFSRRVRGGAGSPSVVAPRCAATFVRSRFKWTRAFLVPRPRLASLSSTRPIFMTAPCTVKMLTPFGAACPPVVHAIQMRSCSPHRQSVMFLWGFFRSLDGGEAAIDAGRLLSAKRFLLRWESRSALPRLHAHFPCTLGGAGSWLFIRQVV